MLPLNIATTQLKFCNLRNSHDCTHKFAFLSSTDSRFGQEKKCNILDLILILRKIKERFSHSSQKETENHKYILIDPKHLSISYGKILLLPRVDGGAAVQFVIKFIIIQVQRNLMDKPCIESPPQ